MKFVAGQQKLMPELLAMVAQTVNAYTRLIPGFWAPTDATWGVENRTTALRVIPGSSRVSFVQREGEGAYSIVALDPASKRTEVLVKTVEGSSDRDYAWMPDGQTLLMSAGTKVFAWSRGGRGWREVLDVAPHGLGAVHGERLHVLVARALSLHRGVGVADDGDDGALVLADEPGDLLEGRGDARVVEGIGDGLPQLVVLRLADREIDRLLTRRDAGEQLGRAREGRHFDLNITATFGVPITLVEYSDFTCGFCLKFFRETWPRIQAKYVETGKVRFLYRDYPRADRGPGLDAALAARCAGDQGQYWPMHDRLFSAGGRLDAAALHGHAKAIGLDPSRFSRCLQDARHTKSIFQDREQGVSLGFRGTPGFLLLRTDGGPKDPALVIPGAFPFDIFEEQIERMLTNASGSRGKG